MPSCPRGSTCSYEKKKKLALPSRKKKSCHLRYNTRLIVNSCQRHCFAISSSSIWVACCLDLSSRLVLLASKPRRARSSSGLALWKSPLRAIFGGPWGRLCRKSRFSMTAWGLDLQYSVQMWSLSCASSACKGLEKQFTAQIPVYGSHKINCI